MHINFKSKSYNFNKKEILNFFNQLNSSKTYTQGKFLLEFENQLSAYLKVKNSLVVTNAVSAMSMIVDVLDLKEKHEIIIPAHTYLASAYPFLKKTSKIKWADIDINTRVTNLEFIKNKFTKHTKVIVVVHLYGYMVDVKPIADFAKKNNIILIEDAAQSIGCSMNGRSAGSFGDFSIISFQSQKNLTTLGEGGALVFKNSKYQKIFKLLRHNGHLPYIKQKKYWKPAMSNAIMPQINGNELLPHNFCLPELNCIAGIYLLKKIDKINQKKRANANYFFNKIQKIKKYINFNYDLSKRNNYHLLVGLCIGFDRDLLIDILFKKHNIQCIVQYYPLYNYNLFKNVKNIICKNTDIFYKNMISIPFHYDITKKELEYIAKKLIKTVEHIIENKK